MLIECDFGAHSAHTLARNSHIQTKTRDADMYALWCDFFSASSSFRYLLVVPPEMMRELNEQIVVVCFRCVGVWLFVCGSLKVMFKHTWED